MISVTAAILIKEGKLFIAQRKRGDKLSHKWEFPGGKVEEGEAPEDCLKREMKEEFGIDVSVGKFFGSSIYHYEHGSITLLAYQTQWIAGEFNANAHEEYKWVSFTELGDYDFAPADIPFVESLRRGDIELQSWP
jgi:8-oxo-dGTP diphosphatase